MIEVNGKAGIVAKVLADSVNQQGNRLITYELIYPRIIHSELLTHKMLCSNSASSRAIPFAKMAEQLTGELVRFGQANPGMQDKGEDFEAYVGYGLPFGGWYNVTPDVAWAAAKEDAIKHSEAFFKAGYHKQVYNRLIEPFQMMKTVISGTEWENFFWLRNHSAADPTLHELARCMYKAREKSVPQILKAGDWHLPYISGKIVDEEGKTVAYAMDKGSATYTSLEEAIKVSCARTAAVSFRNEDYGLEKCLEVYDKLINSNRVHASATQHCATPIQDKLMCKAVEHCLNYPTYPETWESGVSHVDREGNLWSAQYKGFIMYRKLIPNENYTGK